MSQLTKVKQNIHEHKDKSCNLKNTKRQTQGPTGLYELFLLTVPIEEVACCQYKTVQIVFPLNLQTITITLDVIKWRGGGNNSWNSPWICLCFMHKARFYRFSLATRFYLVPFLACELAASIYIVSVLFIIVFVVLWGLLSTRLAILFLAPIVAIIVTPAS